MELHFERVQPGLGELRLQPRRLHFALAGSAAVIEGVGDRQDAHIRGEIEADVRGERLPHFFGQVELDAEHPGPDVLDGVENPRGKHAG